MALAIGPVFSEGGNMRLAFRKTLSESEYLAALPADAPMDYPGYCREVAAENAHSKAQYDKAVERSLESPEQKIERRRAHGRMLAGQAEAKLAKAKALYASEMLHAAGFMHGEAL